MTFSIETEQEEDGRWLAEVMELPGVMAYGATLEDAISKVQALAERVVADRIEHGESDPSLRRILSGEAAYRLMAADEAREAEALEWAEGTIGDVADEA